VNAPLTQHVTGVLYEWSSRCAAAPLLCCIRHIWQGALAVCPHSQTCVLPAHMPRWPHIYAGSVSYTPNMLGLVFCPWGLASTYAHQQVCMGHSWLGAFGAKVWLTVRTRSFPPQLSVVHCLLSLLSWVAQMQGVNALLNTHSGVPCVGSCAYTALSASQVVSQSGGLSYVLQWCKLQWSAVRQASWLGYSSTAAERGLLCTCPTYLGLGKFWSRRGAEGSGGAGVYAALSSLCSTSTRLCSTSQYLLYPSLSTLWSGQMGAGIGLAWQGLARPCKWGCFYLEVCFCGGGCICWGVCDTGSLCKLIGHSFMPRG
jgi:hypothetical protein